MEKKKNAHFSTQETFHMKWQQPSQLAVNGVGDGNTTF
jgi:hypothetical protein